MIKKDKLDDNLSNITEEIIEANTYSALKEILVYVSSDYKEIAKSVKKVNKVKMYLNKEIEEELNFHRWTFRKIDAVSSNNLSSVLDKEKHVQYRNNFGALRTIDANLLKELLRKYNIVYVEQKMYAVEDTELNRLDMYPLILCVDRNKTREALNNNQTNFEEEIKKAK